VDVATQSREHPPMSRLVRLLTVVEVADDAHARRLSVSASLEGVLHDGRRVPLLDDRGWSEEPAGAGAPDVTDVWLDTAEHDIVRTARTVVGPDEPFGGRSRDDMVESHWEDLARRLRAHGVVIEAAALRRLPHDVELSDALLVRLRRRLGDGV
jgi:hypothetical protein